MDEHKLLQTWSTFSARLTWQNVLRKADSDRTRQVAHGQLATLAPATALEALTANVQLVDLLVGRRWYVILAAREAGATWDEIGAALGVSAQDAYDWYQRKIADRERYVPDVHDAARARAALAARPGA